MRPKYKMEYKTQYKTEYNSQYNRESQTISKNKAFFNRNIQRFLCKQNIL